MKRFTKTALLMTAVLGISLAVAGCGKNDSTTNPALGGPTYGGIPSYAGGITPVPNGTGIAGGQIQFTGGNVYDSGVRVTAQTAGFSQGMTGNLTIGAANIPVGQAGTLSGVTMDGSSLSMIATPVSGQPLYANVAGVLNLSPQFMAANFPSGTPQILGLAIDVYMSGATIYGGSAWICTSRDQSGTCHGAYVEFIPH